MGWSPGFNVEIQYGCNGCNAHYAKVVGQGDLDASYYSSPTENCPGCGGVMSFTSRGISHKLFGSLKQMQFGEKENSELVYWCGSCKHVFTEIVDSITGKPEGKSMFWKTESTCPECNVPMLGEGSRTRLKPQALERGLKFEHWR